MFKDHTKDRIDGDKIIIYDNSGRQPEVIKHIIIISEDGTEEYRLQKTKNRKYSMQK